MFVAQQTLFLSDAQNHYFICINCLQEKLKEHFQMNGIWTLPSLLNDSCSIESGHFNFRVDKGKKLKRETRVTLMRWARLLFFLSLSLSHCRLQKYNKNDLKRNWNISLSFSILMTVGVNRYFWAKRGNGKAFR